MILGSGGHIWLNGLFNDNRDNRTMILAIIAFALLAAYLVVTARKFGLPEMVSDTYYQLGRRWGWVFTAVMVTVAWLMMVAILDTGRGVQCLAFLGCGGLMFVGVAPNYCDRDTYPVHKGGAMIAALGCVGWCMSVSWWPTLLLASMLAAYVTVCEAYRILDAVWYMSRGKTYFHPLYWAELAGFADVFLTYFLWA